MKQKICELCGTVIENAVPRQRFCTECARERKNQSSRKHYITHKEYYSAQSKKQAQRLKQERLAERQRREQELKLDLSYYTIDQVSRKAMELGISYGRCSYLLSIGKVYME